MTEEQIEVMRGWIKQYYKDAGHEGSAGMADKLCDLALAGLKLDRVQKEAKINAENFRVTNQAYCAADKKLQEVIAYGEEVALWITGDPYEDGPLNFITALMAIKTAHQLGMQRNNELNQLRAQYNELIMAVSNKYPEETRHQTALRYITEREQRSGGLDSAKDAT